MLMAPPGRGGDEKRHLMSVREDAYAGFDLAIEVRRLLWCAVSVLGIVLVFAAKFA